MSSNRIFLFSSPSCVLHLKMVDQGDLQAKRWKCLEKVSSRFCQQGKDLLLSCWSASEYSDRCDRSSVLPTSVKLCYFAWVVQLDIVSSVDTRTKPTYFYTKDPSKSTILAEKKLMYKPDWRDLEIWDWAGPSKGNWIGSVFRTCSGLKHSLFATGVQKPFYSKLNQGHFFLRSGLSLENGNAQSKP